MVVSFFGASIFCRTLIIFFLRLKNGRLQQNRSSHGRMRVGRMRKIRSNHGILGDATSTEGGGTFFKWFLARTVLHMSGKKMLTIKPWLFHNRHVRLPIFCPPAPEIKKDGAGRDVSRNNFRNARGQFKPEEFLEERFGICLKSFLHKASILCLNKRIIVCRSRSVGKNSW